MKKYIRSALVYQGSKYRLLPQIEPLFPKNIDTFYDVFGGSATVTVNANAKHYIYNEFNSNIYNVLKTLVDLNFEDIDSYINNTITNFGLSTKYLEKMNSSELLQHKQSYRKLVDHFNKNRSTFSFNEYNLFLLTLHIYSFSHNISFNKKGEFNANYGSRYYSTRCALALRRFVHELHNKELYLFNTSFEQIDFTKLTKNDFVYLDPPYLITNAEYNKNWTTNHEKSLLNLLEYFIENDIRFGLSNVTHYKDLENNYLIDFIAKYADKLLLTTPHIKYRQTAIGCVLKSTEVYITNYKPIEVNLF